MYIGNGAYCYANSASMFVKGIGEEVSPSLLEVLSGVGLGVTMYGNGSIFLHNNTADPDVAISNALKMLGYSFVEEKSNSADVMPMNELKEVLKTSTAILGPVDMGYLTYSPNHQYAKGADHYVLAYDIDEHFIYVHDPASFPYVRLPLEKLELAWKADDIPYGRGPFQYWHSIKKINSPSEAEIYRQSIEYFQHLYEETGKIGAQIGAKTGREAIDHFVEKIQNGQVSEAAVGNLKYFVFQLGAKRANDFSRYFEKNHRDLSELKKKQAEILGLCHSLTVEEEFKELARALQEFGKVEEEFENSLLSIKVLI